MKSKDTDFPDLLLQQFNCREAEEAARVAGSKDGKAKGDSEEEQQSELPEEEKSKDEE